MNLNRYKSGRGILIGIIILLATSMAIGAQGQQKPPRIKWQKGPAKADLGKIAGLRIPRGYIFADGDDTRKLMRAMGNKETGTELGYVQAMRDNSWFIVFEFSNVGYIKGADQETLDTDALLKSLKAGNKQGNKWRKEKGIPALELIGWQIKPHFDKKTRNLEWATLLESQGQKVVNYNIRLLGRKGVMQAVIVAGPKNMGKVVKSVKKMLKGYDFKAGNRYADFREGDKIAKYGLAALITGGVVAAAAKSGLLGKLWKFIVPALIAFAAFFKKIFGGLFGGNKTKNLARRDDE